MNSRRSEKGARGDCFAGFEHLTANYIYCPNQFFDICLRHGSRGVVRLVAYLIRQTLGWLDKNGEPITQDIAVPFNKLVTEAGISRGAIRPALDEAMRANFIECIEQGQPGTCEQAGNAAQFRLQWDEHGDHTTDQRAFAGFFAREGNRTPIPNAFFDHVVRHEPLAVIKVVGTVLRHTVGHQNQFGGRRSDAPLSYSFIQRYANVKHRPTLAEAIRVAIERGYIERVDPGVFDPNGRNNRPATYAVRWLSDAVNTKPSSKTEPGSDRQFKNRTGRSSESAPVEQFKNRTDRKTPANNTDKQQPRNAVAAESSQAIVMLRDAGFDKATAADLSQRRTVDEIGQQIEWLPLRNVRKNRLGLLRRAIEEAWAKPEGTRPAPTASPALPSSKSDGDDNVRAERLERRHDLLLRWQALSTDQQRKLLDEAIDQATSELVQSRLRRCHDIAEQPPLEVLRLVADHVSTPAGESA